MVFAVAVGCANAPASTPPQHARMRAIEACDTHEELDTPRRAWIAGTSGPVVAIEVADLELRVAAVMPAAVILRTVPLAQLRPVVIDETAVAPRIGAPADPSLRVLPGFPLPATTAPWIPVESAGEIAFTGVVPAGVRGLIWIEPAAGDGSAMFKTFEVRAAPSATSALRATLHAGAKIRARGPAVAEWVPIIARGAHAIVEGFVHVPPQRTTSGEFDFGDEIEGELISYLPAGTCLWDAPRGHQVGSITGLLVDRPKAVEAGWSEVVLDTPWGKVAYYAHADIVDPKPPGDAVWPFASEWNPR